MVNRKHHRWMQLAKQIATWSKDPNTQVGCILVDENERVIGTGYNGFPKGIKDDDRLNDERKYDLVVHAEMNAILNNPTDREFKMYVTRFPCSHCAKHILQTKCFAVFGGQVPLGWERSAKKAQDMFDEGYLYWEVI